MDVPDLRSPAVQKLTDAELAQVISDGKGGMPSFKGSLSDDQIHGLVTCIRSLAANKSVGASREPRLEEPLRPFAIRRMNLRGIISD